MDDHLINHIFTLNLPIAGQPPIPVKFFEEGGEIWYGESPSRETSDHPLIQIAQEWEADDSWVVTHSGAYLFNMDKELLYGSDGARHIHEYPDMDIETQWWLINELLYNRQKDSYAGRSAIELALIYIRLIKSGSEEADALLSNFLNERKKK